MGQIIEVESIRDAVALAVSGKEEGRWDLFRGEVNATWRVTSSLERVSEERQQKAIEKFERFVDWARRDNGMSPYFAVPDSLWAIAQHYGSVKASSEGDGMRTRFIDFSEEPKIAAFFACDAPDKTVVGKRAAIVCLKSEIVEGLWKRLWPILNKTNPDIEPPQFVRVAVQNLWRLEKQRGCFLRNPVDQIEQIYAFDRIVFPYVAADEALPLREDIYPPDQSELEKRLAAFFMNERMGEWSLRTRKTDEWDVLRISVPESYYDIGSWCPEYKIDSSDWDNLSAWTDIRVQHADDALPGASFLIQPTAEKGELDQQIRLGFTREFVRQNRMKGIRFEGSPNFSKADGILVRVRRLWNGMRTLPYTEDEIVTSLNAMLDLYRIKTGGRIIRDAFGEGGHHVQICESEHGRGAYSEGCCTHDGFRMACRAEFIEAVRTGPCPSEEFLDAHLPQAQALPWQRFSFDGLRRLMVEELIPTQVAWRAHAEGDEGLGYVIYFSPTEFKLLGFA